MVLLVLFCYTFSVLGYQDSDHSNLVFKQFYELPKNTVDAVYIGPSSARWYWNASYAFHKYGITVYPLATGNQPFSAAKYLIKEAEKTQNPSLYIIDIRMLYSDNLPYESFVRTVTDNMKFSANRFEAINDILKFGLQDNDNYNIFDFYFSFTKYHTRWKELTIDDFVDSSDVTMGYTCLNGVTPLDYPTDEMLNAEAVPLSEYSSTVLNEFLVFCKDEDVNVIFVNSPHLVEEAYGKLETAKHIIRNEGFEVLDFNDKWTEIGLDPKFDMREILHVNPYGALKYTDYFSKFLIEKYNLQDHRNDENYEIWEDSYQIFEINLLQSTTNLYHYLNVIDNPRYTTFISVRDEAASNFTETMYQQMANLGLKSDLRQKVQQAYIAVIDQGEVVYEALAPDKTTQLSYNYTLQNGLECKITSGGLYSGNVSSILIGENEYSMNQRGLNFVIYDNVTQSIVDQVCFDTWDHPNCEGNYPYFRAN